MWCTASAVPSGIFRISLRRERGAVGVEGVGCGEGTGPSPEKLIFASKNDKFGCMHFVFDAVFNRQKTRTVTRSLACDTDFTVQSRNEAYKTVEKFIQKFTVRPNRSIAPPPEYATGSAKPAVTFPAR